MVCPNCRREIAEYSNYCYFCGAHQGETVVVRPAGPRRLMRSSTDAKLGGVCGGLAERFDADPGVIRILVTLATIASGFVFGVVAYMVAWVILPLGPAPASGVAAASPTGAGSAPAA